METYTPHSDTYPYTLETYFVRQKLDGRLAWRARKGKSVSPEAALYLSVLRIRPEHPVCTVQLIHGIDERKERYIPFMQYLASRNIACVIHDLRGHGGSLLPEGLGYYGDEALDRLHTDLDAVYASSLLPVPESGCMEIAYEDFPAIDPLPRYLLGFSMGALIAGSYAGSHDDRLAGMLLAGLPHREPLISFALTWVRFLSLIGGETWHPPLLSRFSFRKYNKVFTKQGEEGTFLWLSENRENIETFRADSLCGAVNTISAYRFLLTLVRDMYTPASWNTARPDLPIWLLSGENDPIAGGDRWVLDSEEFLRDMGYQTIENRIFPHCRHEIFMETNRHAIWQETADSILAANETELARLSAAIEADAAQYTSMFE